MREMPLCELAQAHEGTRHVAALDTIGAGGGCGGDNLLIFDMLFVVAFALARC